MITRTVGFCNLLLALLLVLPAGYSPAAAQQIFSMDAAGFRQKGGLIYLEVYFMIQRDRLKFVQVEDEFQARCTLSLEVSTPDTFLSKTNWELEDRAIALEDILTKHKLPDLVAYNLPPGQYILTGTVKDLNTDSSYTRKLNTTLQTYSDSALIISDIELATRLQRSEAGNKFYKNGFLVVPNPERIYGSSLQMLYYFAEIYNLTSDEGEYSVDRVILDHTSSEKKRLPLKTHKKVGESVVEVDGISVASLVSGTYYLKLEVKDLTAQTMAVKQTKFFVYRPEDFATQSVSQDSSAHNPTEQEIRAFSEAQLDEAVTELEYLVNDAELRLVNSLNDEAKRYYLISFWNQRDDQPDTPNNEYRAQFLERKLYCNNKFNFLNRPGWQTDRGRVYIQLGVPDNIENHTHDLETRPYEIWYYDSVEGGVEFVFVDRQNSGDYKLAHSTKKGEIYRPNWLQEQASVRQ